MKTCESLAVAGKINEKVYGKQKVYAPKQVLNIAVQGV